MRLKDLIVLMLLGGFALQGCKKNTAVDDVAPQIKILNVSSYEVVQFEENLKISIEYTDNNGDLGDIEPDTLSLHVHDSRLSKPDRYHMKPMSPAGFELRVTGFMEIVIPAPFLLGGSDPEKVTYTLKVKDRAGNWSNEVSTEPITITP